MRRFGILVALMASAAAARAIEVSAPVDRTTLRGGSYALLSWSAEKLPTGTEEWEAFLSIDGGSRYAFRITPHLDRALQRVRWLVPNVDAADARILIRVGDEKDEREHVLPLSFSIVRDRRSPLPMPAIAPTEPGERGVVQWAEGDRAGTRIRQVMRVLLPGRMQSLHGIRLHDSAPADSPKRSPVVVSNLWRTAALGCLDSGGRLSSTKLPNDLLLKIHRQNI